MVSIYELTTAFGLCMCGATCTLSCPICYSPRWRDGPCIQQLWAEHTASAAGKAAAQRFNEMVDKPFTGIKVIGGLPYAIVGDRKMSIDGQITPYIEVDVLTDAEIVERIIDFTEALGMYLEPWQAAALRVILLHGGDVEIGLHP